MNQEKDGTWWMVTGNRVKLEVFSCKGEVSILLRGGQEEICANLAPEEAREVRQALTITALEAEDQELDKEDP